MLDMEKIRLRSILESEKVHTSYVKPKPSFNGVLVMLMVVLGFALFVGGVLGIQAVQQKKQFAMEEQARLEKMKEMEFSSMQQIIKNM